MKSLLAESDSLKAVQQHWWMKFEVSLSLEVVTDRDAKTSAIHQVPVSASHTHIL